MPASGVHTQGQSAGISAYRPRRPERTVLRRVVREHLESYLATAGHDDDLVPVVPDHVEAAFREYLGCGILAHGFARVYGAGCGRDFLFAFSCKGRDVCPSCATGRMVETAAHLVDAVLPRVPFRQWVLSVPKRVRWHMRQNFSEPRPAPPRRARRLFVQRPGTREDGARGRNRSGSDLIRNPLSPGRPRARSRRLPGARVRSARPGAWSVASFRRHPLPDSYRVHAAERYSCVRVRSRGDGLTRRPARGGLTVIPIVGGGHPCTAQRNGVTSTERMTRPTVLAPLQPIFSRPRWQS